MTKLCLFSPLKSFQAPNGLRSIKLTAFIKAVQYLNIKGYISNVNITAFAVAACHFIALLS